MKKLIKRKAQFFGIEFEILASIIWQESRGNPWATRVEPNFYSRYIQPVSNDKLPGYFPHDLISATTERWHRATSWGLMQIMGETARENGFRRDELTRLLIPNINLEYGCRLFNHLLKSSSGDTYEARVRMALAAYNTGRRDADLTEYDDLILGHVKSGAYNQMFD